MNPKFYKKFTKRYQKLPTKFQHQADERLVLFRKDPFNELLNNHVLSGKYLGYRSINITGDLRAIYKMLNNDIAFFVDLNSHSNLYK